MEESYEETVKRDEILRIYTSTKEALRLIEEISRTTVSDQLPQNFSTPSYNSMSMQQQFGSMNLNGSQQQQQRSNSLTSSSFQNVRAPPMAPSGNNSLNNDLMGLFNNNNTPTTSTNTYKAPPSRPAPVPTQQKPANNFLQNGSSNNAPNRPLNPTTPLVPQ